MAGKWFYAFDCKSCERLKYIGDAFYCVPLMTGNNPIHADDDYVVRCDDYEPTQMTLWEVSDG